jgi:DNA repair protein RecN (Recombination protein N)
VLLELRLRNLAVIESVALPLGEGLNVLSGETGAGKSLVVGALGLLLGGRADSDRVRAGADRAVVEGVFTAGQDAALRARLTEQLDARGIDAGDDCVILRRELARGRSRAWVNGTPVTAAVLGEIAREFVTVHGQHETYALQGGERRRALLDRFGGHTALARDMAAAHGRVQEARAALTALEERAREARQRADYLRFVTREIDEAELRDDEEAELDAALQRLGHAEELRGLATEIADRLAGGGGAVEQLAKVRRALETAARLDPALAAWRETFDAAWYAAEELARDAEQYAEGVESDPRRLRELEARRAVLSRLQARYGPSVADVIETARAAREELALVDAADDRRAEVRGALERALAAREAVAAALTAARVRAADRLAGAVNAELPALGLPDGRLTVRLMTLAEPGAGGAEDVAFDVTLNAGAPAGPIERIASGGELSRVMLALSAVLAEREGTPVLVFDEIDAGIGGEVAWRVGGVMRRLASAHQVLAISHLAQLAAHATHHVVVRKGTAGGMTTADVTAVRGDARIAEVARMLGGDADREVSRAHARELLDRAAGPQGAEATAGAPAEPQAATTRPDGPVEAASADATGAEASHDASGDDRSARGRRPRGRQRRGKPV